MENFIDNRNEKIWNLLSKHYNIQIANSFNNEYGCFTSTAGKANPASGDNLFTAVIASPEVKYACEILIMVLNRKGVSGKVSNVFNKLSIALIASWYCSCIR